MNHALLSIGFRPFFLLAGGWAVISILLWAGAYFHGMGLAPSELASLHWHAHEMIYGYSMAVVAGFLLTAVRNWTGKDTLTGLPLLLCALTWLIARLALVGGELLVAAIADIGFILMLFVGVARPIITTHQKRQYPILGKLVFFTLLNLSFYLGALGLFDSGVHIGIYGGLYLIIGLIIMMAGRVVPFFTFAADKSRAQVQTSKVDAMSGMLVFLVFFITELTGALDRLNQLAAAILALLILIRLYRWYQPVVLQQSLLWVLYLAMIWIAVGFAMKAGSSFLGISPFLSLHAMAYGGIGMITLGMMTRVSIGHTGRQLYQKNPLSTASFAFLMLGGVIRVIAPALMPQHYLTWIGLSQALWILAFGCFLYQVWPMLTRPRL